jgi:DNA-binding transcriptional LysR family regulator
MRSLNLDQLRAFVEVVERGSFTVAATELNLTQHAVTHQVQELERRFKVAPWNVGGRPTGGAKAEVSHVRHEATRLHHAYRRDGRLLAARAQQEVRF